MPLSGRERLRREPSGDRAGPSRIPDHLAIGGNEAAGPTLAHLQDVHIEKAVANCDAVFDTVGGEVAQRSFAVLKPGGRAAFIASGAQAPKPQRAGVTALRPPVGRARRHLERIVEPYQAGVVRPPEIKLYRLSEAADASFRPSRTLPSPSRLVQSKSLNRLVVDMADDVVSHDPGLGCRSFVNRRNNFDEPVLHGDLYS